jgi:hypothetical protein
MINLINLNHPITQELPPDLSWGTNNLLGPVFHVTDPWAITLGNVVYSQGRCRPGFVVKEYPEWKSIYSAAPNLPAGILRGIANYAGVHIYSHDGDVLYATSNFLAIHTASGGKRDLKLPKVVERVYDLFSKVNLGTDTNRFEVVLPPASTSLYFLGESSQLVRLHPL